MLFAVDVGNTNMEFGVFDGAKLIASFRLGTNRDITSDEIGLFVRQFLLIHDVVLDDIEDVIITSVVPQIMHSMKNAMRKYLKKEPLIVQENISINIVNKYKNESEVGADRLVNAYAVAQKYKGPLIVVDFGTATTFDVIDREGAYLGGVIYPGIKISLDALTQKTSKLPTVQIVKPKSVIGKTTITSMQAGIVYGYTGAVINLIKEIEAELGEKTTVIATGGLARMIGEQTNVFEKIEKTLTLEGLQMIYEDYKKNA